LADTESLTRFVNRVEEFEELKRHLDAVLRGEGRFVVIAGEAGIGKTRLVIELKNYASQFGVRFYRGRCLYNENSDPYLPLIDALNQYFEESGEKKEDQGALLPIGITGLNQMPANENKNEYIPIGIGADASDVKPIEKIDVDTERDKMFGTITNLVVEISKIHPIAIFIDDLQWADTGTLQLLHYLTRNMRNARVLLLGAYRPEDLQEFEGVHPLIEIMQRMRLERLYHQIELQRLKYEHVQELVKAILQVSDISPTFMKRLYLETEGNPFFIEEVCKSLIEEGIVKPGGYAWDVGIDWEKIPIPNTIKDVISRRIARLDEVSKKVLMYAAVIGHEFKFNILSKAVEMNEVELLDPIDKLINMKLIKESETAEETYVFEHAQLRTVVYESLSKSRLRIMHKKLGEIIEEMYKDSIDEVVFVLARHFTIGKVQDKALEYNIRAGDTAKKLFAYHEALRYYDTALQLLEEEDISTIEKSKRVIQLLQTVGELKQLLGKWDDALTNFEKIVEICRKINDERSMAYALIAIGNIRRRRGEFEIARKCYEEALKAFEKTKDIKGLADCYRGIGYILWRQGDYDGAIAEYNTAMKQIIQTGDIKRLGTVFIELGNVYGDRGIFSKSEEYFKKAIEELKKVNDLNELARAHNNLGDLYMQEGMYAKAIENFEKCREYAEKIGNIDWVGWALFNMAEVYTKTGEIEKAKQCNMRARPLMETINDKIGMQSVLRIEGSILFKEGKVDDALKSYQDALTVARELQMPYNEAETLLEYGTALLTKGSVDAALDAFLRARTIYEKIGMQPKIEKLNELIAKCKKNEKMEMDHDGR